MEGDLQRRVGRNLQRYRAERGLSQEALAEIAGVHRTYLGGLEEGVAGRHSGNKVLLVVAAQADGKGIGRIRLRPIQDASAGSLHPFIKDFIEPGSTVHTDGWQGYKGLGQLGYDHEVTVIGGNRKHLAYYLDEFTFRFNRRRSTSRGKLFFRLVEQAVATDPTTYSSMVHRVSTVAGNQHIP